MLSSVSIINQGHDSQLKNPTADTIAYSAPMLATRSVSPRLVLAGAILLTCGYVVRATREVSVSIRVVDGTTGQRVPVRVRLQDSTGMTPRVSGALGVSENALPVPKQAIAVMWGQDDRAQGYALQPDGAFYVDGEFEAQLPLGTYTLTVSKGFEYLQQSIPLEIRASASTHDFPTS